MSKTPNNPKVLMEGQGTAKSFWDSVSTQNPPDRAMPKVPGIAAGNAGAGQGVTVGNSRTSLRQSIKMAQGKSDSRFDGRGAGPFTGRLAEHWESAVLDFSKLEGSLREIEKIASGTLAGREAPAVDRAIELFLAERIGEADEIRRCRRSARRAFNLLAEVAVQPRSVEITALLAEGLSGGTAVRQ